MEERIRMRSTPASGLNNNAIAQVNDLAGGRTMWHPRFLQFPNRHMVDGPVWDGLPPYMKGLAVIALLGVGAMVVGKVSPTTKKRLRR